MTDRQFRQVDYPFPWYGFNVCKGHIFGTVDDVQYVSAAEPGPAGTIRVYFSPYYGKPGRNWRKWLPSYVPVNSPVGRRVMEAKRTNPESCVEIRDVQIDSTFLRGNRQRAPHKIWKKH